MQTIRPTTSALLRDRTALIADDDDITRELLRGILRAAGVNVVSEAANGKAAVEQCQKSNPEFVCLDIDMPGLNGLEALEKIREFNQQAIVLMVTATATASNVRTAMEKRANGIIAKPFNSAKVIAEMERAFTRVRGVAAGAA